MTFCAGSKWFAPARRSTLSAPGATVDFDERGDQINRSFLHQVIENGKNRIVDVVT